MNELERIGRLILYRNRILEKLLRELSKDFPNMEIVLEEFVRLFEAIDDLDNETVRVIAELKEKSYEKAEVETKSNPKSEQEDFEEWVAHVLNSFNGSDSMKNYMLVLRELGGIAPTHRMRELLGMKKQTLSEVEKELESRGIIGSITIADRKIVFFNHPKFSGMSVKELERALKSISKSRLGSDRHAAKV